MSAVTDRSVRTFTSKEAHRNWKLVSDKALRAPVVITAHGRPRHVLLAYEDYERLRQQTRQAYRTTELPAGLAEDILGGLDDLAAPRGDDDRDTLIDG